MSEFDEYIVPGEQRAERRMSRKEIQTMLKDRI